MATKIYLESTVGDLPPITPAYDAGWTNTTFAARLTSGTVKQSTALWNFRVYDALTSVQHLLIGQWITYPLTTGQTVTGAQAVAIVARAFEYSTSSNLYFSWVVKIVNSTGGTVRKTLVAKKNDATEVVAGPLTSRTDSATSVAGNYTTQDGDRLVIEIGLEGDPSGAYIHDGTMNFGSSSASDLAMSDGVTTANNPNLTLADTLTFDTSYTVSRSESVWITEVKTVALSNITIDVHDHVTVTEGKTVYPYRMISAHEDIALTESETGTTTPKPSKSELITVTSIPRYYPDEVIVSDYATVSITRTVSKSETITVTESIGISAAFNAVTTQNITVSEAKSVVSATLTISVHDHVAVSESWYASQVTVDLFIVIQSEHIYVTENIDFIPGLTPGTYVGVHDHVAVTERLDFIPALSPTIAFSVHDHVTVTEAKTLSISDALLIAVHDHATITEVVLSSIRVLRVSITDIVSVGSAWTISVGIPFVGHPIHVHEYIAVTESISLVRYGGSMVTDPCRIYTVPWEDRTYEVPAENRTVEVTCE